MVPDSTEDDEEQRVRDEQADIIRLLHRELESIDRRVTRSRARALAIPLREEAADSESARRRSIRKGKLPIRTQRTRANEAVTLIHTQREPGDDDVAHGSHDTSFTSSHVPVMVEPEYDDEGNVLTDGDLLSSGSSSSSSDEEL